MTQIHNTSFTKYLEREQPLLILALFDAPYGEMLQQATGFGFTSQLYYFKGKLGVFYKLANELTGADAYYANLLKTNDSRLQKWITKEADSHQLFETLNVAMSLREIISICQEVMLYNTVIPYRLLSGSEGLTLDDTLIEQLEDTRTESLYPLILANFLPPVLDKLAQKSKIPANLLFNCTPDELIALDEGNAIVGESDLVKRQNGCYFLYEGVWHFELSEKDTYAVVPTQTELKGQIGYKGIVQGRVKIVNTVLDMDKFDEGDILVSINTNPSLMPIMQKCGAIISDEGGITCHAAIVARELHKPCIIGTKHATKVLKDGDVVEVDANNGIITILDTDN